MLNPHYIRERVATVRHHYKTRVILALVDLVDSEKPLEEITKIAFDNNWSLILSWSVEEGGRYLETFKSWENKDAELIKEKVDESDQKAMYTSAIGTSSTSSRMGVDKHAHVSPRMRI